MKQLLYISCLMMLAGCGGKQAVPDNIIPREKFVSLLIRMHILDAQISMSQAMDPGTEMRHYGQYQSLMKDFGVDSAGISRTFDYYQDKQEDLQHIYQEVQDSLVERAKQSVKK